MIYKQIGVPVPEKLFETLNAFHEQMDIDTGSGVNEEALKCLAHGPADEAWDILDDLCARCGGNLELAKAFYAEKLKFEEQS